MNISVNNDITELVQKAGIAPFQHYIPELNRIGKKVFCKLHSDKHTPNLTLTDKSGKITFNCFACGKHGDALDFIQALEGINKTEAIERLKAITANGSKPTQHNSSQKQFESLTLEKIKALEPETGYKYIRHHVYEAGEPSYIKALYRRDSDGDKTARFFTITGENCYKWNRQSKAVLYNQDALQERPAETVHYTEGCKDCETLTSLGFLSVTAGGANDFSEKTNKHLADHFRGRDIILYQDNDHAGRESTQRIARLLDGIASSIKIVEFPGLPDKGDVSEWIQAGGTKKRLLELIKNTPEFDLSEYLDIGDGHVDNVGNAPFFYLKRGADLRTLDCNIEWCINKLLPRESITLLHGRGGIGKTWICLVLADNISRGIPFMGLDTQIMTVVFIDFENSLPVLVDRVRKIGADDVLFWHNANEEMKPPKLDSLNAEEYKHLPKGSLLIFDTLRASQSKDENNSQDMAVIMSKLKDLRDIGFTILLLHHTPKSNDRTYKGSTAILDLADHALSLHKVKKGNPGGGEVEDEDDTDCLYRLGTKDKTRYEPFHVFMSFDKERGFVKAEDPDDEDLQGIYDFLKEKPRLNQNAIFEIAKHELDIRSKGKFISLLKKGDGKYWTSHREGRAVYYQAVETVQLSTPIYRTDGHISDTHSEPVRNIRTDEVTDTLKTLDNSHLSNCPDTHGTERTDVIDLSSEDFEVLS